MRGTIKSNKGFYVGDICYVLGDDIYYGIWGDKENYSDGEIKVGDYSFLVSGTAYGDGVYYSEDGSLEFGVDAGVLGVVPLELVTENVEHLDDYGYVNRYAREATLIENNGVFNFTLEGNGEFKEITVNTANDEEDEYDEDEDF